ncbi:hypothetical protein [Pyxidicoccus caerfyrddinensis]|uniref:hypothetical protein n=1 Tax=Pyxidicoccus caerfyrddinensis TaxID=2709663 RepID=UPI0013DC3F40|nr:hypothetical protein [Pyxidicoccus caerfyrddinensis]
MTLLAELCQVVEERAEPSPWLRRALLALGARVDAAGLRTWHVERAVYGALLLGAVVAQYGATLGATPAWESLRSAVALAASLALLLYGAELDSVSAREREQAQAEGREPVRVECSPRAAQLRALLPWLGLVALAAAFGWVGAVALGWRTAYPHWRRWYRARRPLGRLRWHPQKPAQCGQTCVAMLTGQSVETVCELMGRTGECGAYGLRIAVQAAGLDLDPSCEPDVPRIGRAFILLRHEAGSGHWVLWDGQQVLCPVDGVLSREAALAAWDADGWRVEGHHQVWDAVRFPLRPADVEYYREQGRAVSP